MEKDLFAGVQLMAVKPEEQKREKLTVMQQTCGEQYTPAGLKKALTELRDFVAFDMPTFLSDDVTAKELADKMFVLDFLVRGVEFKELEVLV